MLLTAGLWFGTARFGLMGAISTVVLVTLTERIVMAVRFGGILHVVRQDLRLLQDVGKLASAAAVAALLTAVVRFALRDRKPLMVLIACGIVFSLVYLGGILLAGVVTPEEKDTVRRKLAALGLVHA